MHLNHLVIEWKLDRETGRENLRKKIILELWRPDA